MKQLQKTDLERKRQWSDFCDAHVAGIKDPLRHRRETLLAFLQECGML